MHASTALREYYRRKEVTGRLRLFRPIVGRLLLRNRNHSRSNLKPSQSCLSSAKFSISWRFLSKILTDCQALRTTSTKKGFVSRIARWWVQLQEFDCDIEYRANSRMAHYDTLSRNPIGEAVLETHLLYVLSVNTEDSVFSV